MARKRPVTAHDIATRAGVSRSTVSVVLNNARSTIRVSDETRARIQAIADELGYAPNRTAQALRRRQSGIIGFVPMPVIGMYRPFDLPVQFLLGSYVSRAALDHGFHAVEVPVEIAAAPNYQELTGFLRSIDVDGVIFHGASHVDAVRVVLDQGIPVVELMRPIYDEGSSTVTVDPRSGISDGIRHLIDLGHQHLAFIGTASTHPNDTARKAAFLDCLETFGISALPEYVVETGRYSVEDGRTLAKRLLALPRLPTAIFAAGDMLALGALHALYDAGIRVPDDITLISYDDAFVDSLYPPLTSVSQPFQDVSKHAVSIIAEHAKRSLTGLSDPEHIVYPSKLVVRASSAPARKGGMTQHCDSVSIPIGDCAQTE